MKFLYDPDAGDKVIELTGDGYRHIFRARRTKVGSEVYLRNFNDKNLYRYEIKNADRRKAVLELSQILEAELSPEKKLHIGWCTIDPRNIEKALPYLNETGVEKITFLKCDRSQKQYKIDYERLKKILISSSQQCGRSTLMALGESESISSFLKENPDAYLLDFGGLTTGSCDMPDIDCIVIGCEGGFTDAERSLFEADRIIGINSSAVLRSETAAVVVSAKLLC